MHSASLRHMAVFEKLLRSWAGSSAALAGSRLLGKVFGSGSAMQRAAHCSDQGTMPCSEASSPAASPAKRPRAEEKPRLRFARLSENARTPTRGSERAAGFDLYSAYNYMVPAQDKVIVKTDIQIAVPSGFYGRVAPRSGLAAKYFIDVGAGVIDEDYRGNVGVILFNFGKEPFEVKKGDRIAQLICERICYPELEELKTLDETERGAGGFGSTGTN
ncbi:deoxyuridine 5'-triphosphate nucleotidohydrolase-like [Scyliorhinus torazame]